MYDVSLSSAASQRKCARCLVLFFLLTFAASSVEFGFGFGGSDGDNVGGSVDESASRRRPAAKRFKFHKIERVAIEGDDDTSADDEEKIAADDDESDTQLENDAEDEREQGKWKDEKVSTPEHGDDYQFERVRKAKKDVFAAKKQTLSNTGTWSSFFSFLPIIGGWLNADDERNNAAINVAKETASKTNGIIDWLQWFGAKAGGVKEPQPEAATMVTSGGGWLAYLNRWPFNSLFHIGRPAKQINLPRRSSGDHDDCAAAAAAAPMSQEHFESLLHTLPGFVINATDIADIEAECKNQMQIFHRQLRGNKLWTYQMLDATGKINAGLLRGHINQFGDFDLCTQIKTAVKLTPDMVIRMRGKYCLAHIETQATVDTLRMPLHLAHGRGLWQSHLGNPSHFVPRYTIAKLGVCIPHQCGSDVVQAMIETNLRPYNRSGIEFHVAVSEHDCHMASSSTRWRKLLRHNHQFGTALFILVFLVFVVLAALLADYWLLVQAFVRTKLNGDEKRNDDTTTAEEETNDTTTVEETSDPVSDELVEATPEETSLSPAPNDDDALHANEASGGGSFQTLLYSIFMSFSPRRTVLELLSRDRTDVQFPVLNVFKIGATLALYVCLKYLMVGHLPITNRDQLVRALDQRLSIVFRSPMIYTDMLLLMSGFLTSYRLSQEMERRSSIHMLKHLTAKILRYLPTAFVVLLFQTWLLPHLGDGPLWSNLIGQQASVCGQQMWRNIFSVQNVVDFEETCSPMTVQLAVEIQLYLLAPFIVWLFYIDHDAGFFAYGGLHAMSVAARFARTNREHLSLVLFHGINVSKFYRSANMLYASPVSRATPYLVGIGAGILHRFSGGYFDMSPSSVRIGWLLSAAGIAWCFCSMASSMRSNYIYTASEAASYASWSPLVIGLALAWIIFMFPKDEQSKLNALATSRPLLFVARLVFPIQLAMYTVVLYSTASIKDAAKYNTSDFINVNEIIMIIILAIVLAFLIDIPMQNVRHLVVNRLFLERPQQEHDEPVSGAEQSDGELSEERSEKLSSDTPEPPDFVWPEEDDNDRTQMERSSRMDQNENATTKVAAEEEEKDEKEKEEEEEEEKETKADTKATKDIEREEEDTVMKPSLPATSGRDETIKPRIRQRPQPSIDND